MTDQDNTMNGESAYSDDRLMAMAFGFEDDPGLAAAAESDPVLAGRLEAMREQAVRVEAQIHGAVPAPDESYADPTDERWSAMAEFYEPHEPAPARSRASRWLRILAPAAAAAIAIVVGVGVVANMTGTPQESADSSAQTEQGGPETSREEADGAFGGTQVQDDGTAAPASGSSGQGTETKVLDARSLAKQIEVYAVIVVARAGKVADNGLQRFRVVRELKGEAPKIVRLQVLSKVANVGALHVLFLQSGDGAGGVLGATPTPSAANSAGPSPSTQPSAAAGDDESLRFIKPIRFSFLGARALARELPPGIDPADILLPQ